MLKLAEHILESKEADFDPSRFIDRYEEAVVEMLKEKQAGIATPKRTMSEPPRNVINLMDALKRSIAADKTTGQKPRKSKKRIEGQREMLLPIAGNKGKEGAAKPVVRANARQKRVG